MMKKYVKKFDEVIAMLRGNYRYRLFAERVKEAAHKKNIKEFAVYPIYSDDKEYITGLEVTVYGKSAEQKHIDKIIKQALLLEEAA